METDIPPVSPLHKQQESVQQDEAIQKPQSETTKKLEDMIKSDPFPHSEERAKSSIAHSVRPMVSPRGATGPSASTKSDRIMRLEAECPALSGKFKSSFTDISVTNPSEMMRFVTEEPGQDHDVVLLRGCSEAQLKNLAMQATAGGVEVNATTDRPSEQDASDQVAEKIRLPEFTSHEGTSQAFGTNNFVIAIKINTRYLAQGSKSFESGWIANPSAPVELLAWKEGRSLSTQTIPSIAKQTLAPQGQTRASRAAALGASNPPRLLPRTLQKKISQPPPPVSSPPDSPQVEKNQ